MLSAKQGANNNESIFDKLFRMKQEEMCKLTEKLHTTSFDSDTSSVTVEGSSAGSVGSASPPFSVSVSSGREERCSILPEIKPSVSIIPQLPGRFGIPYRDEGEEVPASLRGLPLRGDEVSLRGLRQREDEVSLRGLQREDDVPASFGESAPEDMTLEGPGVPQGPSLSPTLSFHPQGGPYAPLRNDPTESAMHSTTEDFQRGQNPGPLSMNYNDDLQVALATRLLMGSSMPQDSGADMPLPSYGEDIPSPEASSSATLSQSPSDLLVRALASSIPRRSRGEKKPIPDMMKDEKYYERRKRNNMAAKKSRDARKQREDEYNVDRSPVAPVSWSRRTPS